MNISLNKIIPALVCIGASPEKINDAIDCLEDLLVDLDQIEVKGRRNVDTLLGCMMAIEAIIGEENNGG